jgi:ubiquinone/menaquinone biosynthesis C-methylase UbiE
MRRDHSREEESMSTDSPATDYRELTARGRQTWSSGDFNEIARQTMAVAEDLCREVDPRPNEAVLDIACGSGNLALVAARRYCDVSGIDLAPNLIDRARIRAAADGLAIDFQVGDAQELPFPDASFDVVTSVFGVMFAPDQERAARELLRVCRPGGRIGLASWMPEAFGFDFFGAHARHAPPPAGMASPLRWGTPAVLDELLGPDVDSMNNAKRSSFAYYRSVEHAVGLFEAFFGPTIRAMTAVGETGTDALRADLASVFERYNRADDGTAVVETEYMRTIAIRA